MELKISDLEIELLKAAADFATIQQGLVNGVFSVEFTQRAYGVSHFSVKNTAKAFVECDEEGNKKEMYTCVGEAHIAYVHKTKELKRSPTAKELESDGYVFSEEDRGWNHPKTKDFKTAGSEADRILHDYLTENVMSKSK